MAFSRLLCAVHQRAKERSTHLFAYHAMHRNAIADLRVRAWMSSASKPTAAAEPATKRSHPSESFLSGTSSVYAEQMLAAYKKDPNAVHVSWRAYFENLERGVGHDQGAFEPLPTIQSNASASSSLMVSPQYTNGMIMEGWVRYSIHSNFGTTVFLPFKEFTSFRFPWNITFNSSISRIRPPCRTPRSSRITYEGRISISSVQYEARRFLGWMARTVDLSISRF